MGSPTWPTTAPRLVATDLDNTLLAPDGTLSTRTRDALRSVAGAGIDVVFVSARPLRRLQELAEHVDGHGVAICSNGAAVLDVATGALLTEQGMSAADVTAVVERLRTAWGPDAVHFAVEHARGFDAEHGFVDSHPVPPTARFADRIEELLPHATLKLLVRTSAPWDETFPSLVATVIGELGRVADSGAPGLGEISATDVTKAATLQRLAADRGIRSEHVWAFGDAPNDLPMLRWARTSFAVANAFPEVLAAASHSCPSNAEDGVAQVLEHAAALVVGSPGRAATS
ncbi:HAD family hydrolase [Cellulomonas sp. HZM]|uniref:HAD family hydrolase n=1 Tax=Cellulomonas sp. HZM TaxID=1454010 RepID=UPI00054D552D|nr:HAD-IIB family hydrolase [Cellulomonas sp. HZM]